MAYSLPNTLTNGTPADAGQVMQNFNALLAAANNSVARDGTLGPTSNMVWNGFDLTSVGAMKSATIQTTGKAIIGGGMSVAGTISGSISFSGAVTMASSLSASGAVTLGSTLAVTGNTTVGGTLGVTGALSGSSAAFSGNVTGGFIGTAGAGAGSADITIGSATTTGSLEIKNAAGARQGFIGNAATGGPISYNSDNGAGHQFTGGPITVNGAITVNTNGSTNSVRVVDPGTQGANLTLVGNGSVTASKSIRSQGGNLEFVNSAYNSVVMRMDDLGNLSAPSFNIFGFGKVIYDGMSRASTKLTDGTAAPSGGLDGDLYCQFT